MKGLSFKVCPAQCVGVGVGLLGRCSNITSRHIGAMSVLKSIINLSHHPLISRSSSGNQRALKQTRKQATSALPFYSPPEVDASFTGKPEKTDRTAPTELSLDGIPGERGPGPTVPQKGLRCSHPLHVTPT